MKKPEPAPEPVMPSSFDSPRGAGIGNGRPGTWIRPLAGTSMRVLTSICTTAGATCWKMSAKLSGAPCGGANRPAPPGLAVTRPETPETGPAFAVGQSMTPPAVAPAARNRPNVAPSMNSLHFIIGFRTILSSGAGARFVRHIGPGPQRPTSQPPGWVRRSLVVRRLCVRIGAKIGFGDDIGQPRLLLGAQRRRLVPPPARPPQQK